MIDKDDIAKYKKYTGSNISRANKKSTHKHKYEPCILHERYYYTNVKDGKRAYRDWTFNSSYCIKCGKIGERIIGNDTYDKSLPEFTIESLFQDNVTI